MTEVTKHVSIHINSIEYEAATKKNEKVGFHPNSKEGQC